MAVGGQSKIADFVAYLLVRTTLCWIRAIGISKALAVTRAAA